MNKGTVCGSGGVLSDFVWSWRLENFKSFNLATGEHIRSPDFEKGDNDSWHLEVYPNGYESSTKEFIGCFLKRSPDGETKHLVKFFISLQNSENTEIKRLKAVSSGRVFSKEGSWGWKSAVERSELLDQLPDDVLITCLHITTCQFVICTSAKIQTFPEEIPPMAVTKDLLSLKEDNTDFVIKVGCEGIPVHKLLLAARSDVFFAMVKTEMLEENTGKVEITDFNVDTVKSMVKFLYDGIFEEVNITAALDLLRAAEKYNISDLITACSNFVFAHLNNENVTRILIAADAHNIEKLKIRAIEYFCTECKNFDFEKHSPELVSYPELLLDIIKHSKLTETG